MNRFESVSSPAKILLAQARELRLAAIVAEGMNRHADAERRRQQAGGPAGDLPPDQAIHPPSRRRHRGLGLERLQDYDRLQ